MTTLRGAVIVLGACAVIACGAALNPGQRGIEFRKTVARDTLPHGVGEEDDCGAYSYVLFSHLPIEERDQALLTAFLVSVPTAQDYGGRPVGSMNITYFPIVGDASDAQFADPKWIGTHYDLARAKTILSSQHLTGPGPFIVTASQALSDANAPVPHESVVDLSMATTDSMKLWVTHFVKVSEAPQTWMANGAETLALRVYDSLSAVGESAKLVTETLSEGGKVLKIVMGGESK